MPLGNFGQIPSSDVSTKDLADLVARLIKEVNYLLNGGLDTLNVNELSADVINAGTLNAALVTVKAALAGSAFILLNATQGLIINDGTKNTFQADINGLVTMVGALIKSTNNYPMIQLSGIGNLLQAFADALNYVYINPNETNSPTLGCKDQSGSALRIFMDSNHSGNGNVNVSGGDLSLTSSTGNVSISVPVGNFKINGSIGLSGTQTYVKNVQNGTPIFGTMTFTKGILTGIT